MPRHLAILVLFVAALGLAGCGGSREPQVFWHAQDSAAIWSEMEKALGDKQIGVAPRTDGTMRAIALDDSTMRYADGPSTMVVQAGIDYAIFKLTGQRVIFDVKAAERVVLAGDVDGTITCTLAVGGPVVTQGPTTLVTSTTRAGYSAPAKNEAVSMWVGFCLMRHLLRDQVGK